MGVERAFFFLFQIPHCVRLGTLKQCMKIVIFYLLVHCFFFYLPSSLVIGILITVLWAKLWNKETNITFSPKFSGKNMIRYTQGIASTTFLYKWIRDLQYEWLEFILIINCFLFYHGLIISHTAFNFLTKAGLFFMVIYTKSLFTWNFQLSKLCLIFIFLHNNFSSVFLLSGEDFTFNNWYI